MTRISGPLAVLAGLFLTTLAAIAFVHAQAAPGTVPGWFWRNLLILALCGVVSLIWGGAIVRRRELALHEMEQASHWLRLHR